jgi:SAM-dependent methyltransferase
MEMTEHAQQNREYWNSIAEDWVAPGRRNWAGPPHWGMWHVPESELGLLADVNGLDAIELGCGTAYLSSWLAQAGARPTGVDVSDRQLATARQLQQEFGIQFPLIHASAEAVPLPDRSFDFAVSEYGASIWCDPYRWIPEAARLVRPGGRLVFLVTGTLLMLTAPDEEDVPSTAEMRRDYFGMHRFDWVEGSVEFHLGYGDMIRLLRGSGFEVEDLIELQAPAGAKSRFLHVTGEWAHRWPSEEIWVARRTS